MPISHKNFLFSSSLPSSGSHLHKNAGKTGNSFNNQAQQQRRLTRQRRPRHLTDDEVGLRFGDIHRSFSSPCSPETPAGKDSRSPEGLDHWSSYAEPKPLPLPEVFLNRKSMTSGSSPGPCKLASPDERLTSAVGRKNADHAAKSTPNSLANFHKEFSRGESFRNGSKPAVTTRNGVTSFHSSPASRQRSNTQDHLNSHEVANSTNSLLSRRRGFPHEKDFGSVNHKLRLNVSSRSAPTTVFSSPSVSPQRPRGSIDLDVPYAGRASGYASPLRTAHSPECSPLHIPGQNKNSSHHKLLLENHEDWLDNNSELNSHPLPLPPGAFQSSQSPKPLPSPVPNHMNDKPTPTSIIGQWKKGRLLGRGTYGSVYEATNRVTGALCAMKEVDIIPVDPKSVECVKQLEQEIRVLRRLKHRNIVQYYGSELVDDHFYIYLEYVHPGSINKYVREHCGAITESIVRNFTRHILSGLAFLHSSNTIHRDIKGANLLVDANGIVKLANFGMAKHLTGLSYELSLKGSPYWMAPEVLKSVMKKDSNQNLALAVDIWSLGCTVIEMLNGKPPWSDFEGPQALFKVLNQNPTVPEALSPEGKDFLRCCFQRNPVERPSAAMLLEHPFVRNSADQHGPALVQAFSGMNLTDNSHSQRIEMMSTSPGTRITKGKLPSNSETGLSVYARTKNCAAASHLSPYTSAARVIHGSHSFSPSTHVSSNMALGAVNNHPFAVGRTQGKEVPHI